MGAKGQQAVNTIFAALAAAFLAERWDSLLFDPASPSYAANVQNMELFLIAAIGGGVSFVLEALRAVALDLTDAGRSPRLYKLLGGTLILLALTGCAFQGYPPRMILGDSSFCSGDQVERVAPDGSWERTCHGESMNGAQLSDAAAGVVQGAAGAARAAAGAVIGAP